MYKNIKNRYLHYVNANNYSAGDMIIWIMAVVYPFIVFPGSMSYFYGPRYIFLSIVSIFTVIYLFYSKIKLNKPVYYTMALFLILATVSTVLADDIMIAWGGSPKRFTGLSTYICCAVLFITTTKVSAPSKILKAMVYAASIVSFIAVMQHFGFNIVPHESFRIGFHSYGTFGHPNFLGTYTIFIIPASIMLYFYENHYRWLITSVMLFAALIASMTRGSWLAFLIIFVLIIIYLWGKKQFKYRLQQLALIFTVMFIILSLTKGQVILNRAATVVNEIESALELEDTAGSNRMFIWKEALKIIPNNWAFGVGPDNINIPMPQNYTEDKALNHFLEIAVSMGLFSLFAYLAFLYFCIQERRRDWLGDTFLFMMIAYLLQGQFNIDVIMNLPLYWIVLGLMQANAKIGNKTISNVRNNIKGAGIIRITPKKKYAIYLFIIAITIFIVYISSMLFITREGVIEIEGQGIYTGQIRGATFHGYGIWEMTNGAIYEGEFVNGNYDGYGTLTFTNGSKYVGGFKEGYLHGEGSMITADGRIVEGTWVRGIKVE